MSVATDQKVFTAICFDRTARVIFGCSADEFFDFAKLHPFAPAAASRVLEGEMFRMTLSMPKTVPSAVASSHKNQINSTIYFTPQKGTVLEEQNGIIRSNCIDFVLIEQMSHQYLPVASALLVGTLTATTLSLQQAGGSAQQFISSALWAGVAAGVMATVKANGRQFCLRPRLCGLL
ncbi:hypothetical protein CDL15_Pgr000564 [Punica granatum]|uniref:Uncharacterized protein n=1 Tax=Punica granatum TaxID=22663 RepID=A0A218W4T2_PUNGR|nr:hypothetical protein CDL15_Pgr000564 [Punica granatum]